MRKLLFLTIFILVSCGPTDLEPVSQLPCLTPVSSIGYVYTRKLSHHKTLVLTFELRDGSLVLVNEQIEKENHGDNEEEDKTGD